jgi:endonuclease YncB( thermonuclease family)
MAVPMAAHFRPVALVTLLLALAGCGGERASFSGRVVRILDGDTIEVLRVGRVLSAGRSQRVRLHGIDCPERRQDFGAAARRLTGSLAANRTVTVRVKDVDSYGRTVGEVILPDGRNLNHELVRAGLAWWYRAYAPADVHLAAAENQARAAGRGLWSRPDAVPPWDHRKAERQSGAASGPRR